MKLLKVMTTLCILMVTSISSLAQARDHWYGPRWGIGINVGPYPYYPYYYPYGYMPAYPYASPYVVQQAPIVIQQDSPQVVLPTPSTGAPTPKNVWYFCQQSNAYYPYVTTCAQGWKEISPTPAAR